MTDEAVFAKYLDGTSFDELQRLTGLSSYELTEVLLSQEYEWETGVVFAGLFQVPERSDATPRKRNRKGVRQP